MVSEVSNIRESFAASTFPLPTFTSDDGRVFQSLLIAKDSVKTEKTISIRPMPLTDFVCFELSLVKEVEAILTARHENLFYLWIVVDQFDRATREKIYAREREIIDEFKEFEFDFNIVSRRGRDLLELVSDPMMTLTYDRESQKQKGCAD